MVQEITWKCGVKCAGSVKKWSELHRHFWSIFWHYCATHFYDQECMCVLTREVSPRTNSCIFPVVTVNGLGIYFWKYFAKIRWEKWKCRWKTVFYICFLLLLIFLQKMFSNSSKMDRMLSKIVRNAAVFLAFLAPCDPFQTNTRTFLEELSQTLWTKEELSQTLWTKEWASKQSS